MPLNAETRKRLILSVGTHRGQRPLSPVEAAESFEVLLNDGVPASALAEMVQLNDSTMIGRFRRLLGLSEEVRHLVDWKGGGSAISFSTASEVARLPEDDQKVLCDAVLSRAMTKKEIMQVIQLLRRSHGSLGSCIEQILKLRPTIVQRHVFVGVLTSDSTRRKLREKTQEERDTVLRAAVEKHVGSRPGWSGKLGKDRFSLVGGRHFAECMHQLEPSFEAKISEWVNDELG